MRRKKIKLPVDGTTYRIAPFFSPCGYTALFLSEYTDPQGKQYRNIFMLDNGSFFDLQFVEKWELENA